MINSENCVRAGNCEGSYVSRTYDMSKVPKVRNWRSCAPSHETFGTTFGSGNGSRFASRGNMFLKKYLIVYLFTIVIDAF